MTKYMTFTGKKGKGGAITTLTVGRSYEILQDKKTVIEIRNDKGKKNWFCKSFFEPAPAKVTLPPKPFKEEAMVPMWQIIVQESKSNPESGCGGDVKYIITDGHIYLYTYDEYENGIHEQVIDVLNKTGMKFHLDGSAEQIASYYKEQCEALQSQIKDLELRQQPTEDSAAQNLMRWVRITTNESLPPEENSPNPRKYIVRYEMSDSDGNNPVLHVGWLTASEIQEECQGTDWFEYLDESSPRSYKPVTKMIQWRDLFSENGKDMPEKDRHERWEMWKALCIKDGEQEEVDYWAKDHIEETCAGCKNLDGDWCKYAGLPCNVNPILTFSTNMIGMACMGNGYNQDIK